VLYLRDFVNSIIWKNMIWVQIEMKHKRLKPQSKLEYLFFKFETTVLSSEKMNSFLTFRNCGNLHVTFILHVTFHTFYLNHSTDLHTEDNRNA